MVIVPNTCPQNGHTVGFLFGKLPRLRKSLPKDPFSTRTPFKQPANEVELHLSPLWQLHLIFRVPKPRSHHAFGFRFAVKGCSTRRSSELHVLYWAANLVCSLAALLHGTQPSDSNACQNRPSDWQNHVPLCPIAVSAARKPANTYPAEAQ